MTPPIGSARAGLVSQVGDAIPDSAVWQFDPETFTTGDATWTDDIGDNDMSLTGDPQEDTLSNGDPSIAGDGNDYGLAPAPSALSGSSLGSGFAIEFAVEYTQTGLATFTGAFNSDDSQVIQIILNSDSTLSNEDGNVLARIDDQNSNRLYAAPDTNPNLNDGNRHTVVANYVDPSSNDIEILIDGSVVPSSGETEQNPTSFGSWDVDWAFWARNNEGTIDTNLAAELGLIRAHNQTISEPTI